MVLTSINLQRPQRLAEDLSSSYSWELAVLREQNRGVAPWSSQGSRPLCVFLRVPNLDVRVCENGVHTSEAAAGGPSCHWGEQVLCPGLTAQGWLLEKLRRQSPLAWRLRLVTVLFWVK